MAPSITVTTCQVHRYHTPRPLRLVVHHIQPLGMGGPDNPVNKIVTCDTGHFNMHRLIGDLILTGKMRKGGSPGERSLALSGFNSWVAAGKPGHPVFEIGWEPHEYVIDDPTS